MHSSVYCQWASRLAKTPEKSARDLIDFLTYQTRLDLGTSDCGGTVAEDAAMQSLVRIGSLALPDIERVLDSIEALAQQSPFALHAESVLDAYARVLGPSAFPRLRRMAENADLAFLSFDDAVVISLNLTSYVSSSVVPTRHFFCLRAYEPRDVFDQLILAWERKDLRLLKASLGPTATAALNRLMREQTWPALWGNRPNRITRIGYRLDPGQVALLTDRFGGSCGRQAVQFLRIPPTPFGATFLVDNRDLGSLLRALAACGSE